MPYSTETGMGAQSLDANSSLYYNLTEHVEETSILWKASRERYRIVLLQAANILAEHRRKRTRSGPNPVR